VNARAGEQQRFVHARSCATNANRRAGLRNIDEIGTTAQRRVRPARSSSRNESERRDRVSAAAKKFFDASRDFFRRRRTSRA
jgi:hypothetical protein